MCGTKVSNYLKARIIAKVSVCLKLRKRFRTTAVSPVFQELFFL